MGDPQSLNEVVSAGNYPTQSYRGFELRSDRSSENQYLCFSVTLYLWVDFFEKASFN